MRSQPTQLERDQEKAARYRAAMELISEMTPDEVREIAQRFYAKFGIPPIAPPDETPQPTISGDSAARKRIPLAGGVLDYFPAALALVAKLSFLGNEKHNPGEPLHWARAKSTDHADCLLRHLVDRGIIDAETGMSHTVEVAWRALALLQEELEAAGAPKARGAK